MSLAGLGLGLAGVGALGGILGASKREKAIKKAVKKGKARVNAFADAFVSESKDIKKQKYNILENSDDIFERLGGFIFGGTDSLANLRNAQEDFSELASGDFSSFEKETSAIISSALANTSGSPQGSFSNLSASNLFDFRSKGLQNALSLSGNFASIGSGLINTEFGVIDTDFNSRMRIEDSRVQQLNSLDMQKAGAAGSTMSAIGSGLTSIGSGLVSFNTANQLSSIAKGAGANITSQISQLKGALGLSPEALAVGALGVAGGVAASRGGGGGGGAGAGATISNVEALPQALDNAVDIPVGRQMAFNDLVNRTSSGVDSFINSSIPTGLPKFLGTLGGPITNVFGSLTSAGLAGVRTGRGLGLFPEYLPTLTQPLVGDTILPPIE